MDLTYTIKRSTRRKRLSITVERDRRIVVHAPTDTSEEKIKNIVQSKRQWIHEKINHYQKDREPPAAPGKELVNNESVLFLGSEYQIEIIGSGSRIILAERLQIPSALVPDGKQRIQNWYKRQAKDFFEPRVRRHAESLGVEVQEVRISSGQYRWGSCSPAGNVNLNWRLIKSPAFVIDYVIVHELAHLIEGNHSVEFWNIVKAQSPKMELARDWLKDHGELLHVDL